MKPAGKGGWQNALNQCILEHYEDPLADPTKVGLLLDLLPLLMVP